jgi:tRNA (guanine37-N1)-methyltransferase
VFPVICVITDRRRHHISIESVEPVQKASAICRQSAAMLILDAVMRLVPGVLGDETSSKYDSFAETELLEYPQYTRPREFRGMQVPEVLVDGNHGKIAAWREAASQERTRNVRGEPLERAGQTALED